MVDAPFGVLELGQKGLPSPSTAPTAWRAASALAVALIVASAFDVVL